MADIKHVFARNLEHYLTINQKTRQDLSKALGVSYSSVTQWVNGKKYPRMDKVDDMARYFGISRADLTEEKFALEGEEAQDFYIDVLARLSSDPEFCSFVEDIMPLGSEKILALKQMLSSSQVLAK